jgi:hypothetical protein
MNGGVHHAIECVVPGELVAAADGFAFFGFEAVAEFLRGASTDPVLTTWDEDTEAAANHRYTELIPDDSRLADRFEEVFRDRPEQFAPLGPSQTALPTTLGNGRSAARPGAEPGG